MAKKSTAQPRPKVNVQPKGIGPVDVPNENDVLCGRGGRINSHEGNVQFREIVHNRKKDYLALTTKKLEKAHIAAKLVGDIRSMDPPGRFLTQDADGMWYDIGDAKAFKKVGQALREEAPQIRNEFGDGDSSGDEFHQEPKEQAGASPLGAPVVTPSVKSPAETTKRPSKQYPPNLVSGRGTAHVQAHHPYEQPRPDFTIPQVTSMPPPAQQQGEQAYNPYAAQKFDLPPEIQNSYQYTPGYRGLDALDLTSSAGSGAEQLVFGKPFNATLTSSSSTGYSSISGMSADEIRLRHSSGSGSTGAVIAPSGGHAAPLLKHAVSLGSGEAAVRNSLRTSQIDFEMQRNNLRLEAARQSVFSGQSDVEMQRNSLRLSQIGEFEPRGSTASDLTFSMRSIGTLGDDLLGGSSRQGLNEISEGMPVGGGAGFDDIMHDSWDNNGMPAPLDGMDFSTSLNPNIAGDPQSSGGTSTTGTSNKNLKEVEMPLSGPMRSRFRSAGSGSAVSNMSLGTQGSRRSSSVYSSGRSVMSDLSTEMRALDLAVAPPPEVLAVAPPPEVDDSPVHNI